MSREILNRYLRFAAMIVTAMAAMFAIKYLNTYEFSHVRFSQTRFWMTFVMGAAMAAIMLGFMRGMYPDAKMNAVILVGSAAVFVAALWLVRSQETVGDESWMKAMIPHHSIAILTSERAEISDWRARDLANRIIEAQRREIREMEWLLEDIARNGEARTPEAARARPVPDFGAQDDPNPS